MGTDQFQEEQASIKTSGGNLWNTKEVSNYLNVKESTIRNWVHVGYIPHIKFRGAVRFREKDIVDWLKQCSAAPRVSQSQYSSGILRDRR